jgi:hypothetical protein
MTRFLVVVALAAGLALAGCLGGGGDGADTSSTDADPDGTATSQDQGGQDGTDDGATDRPNATLEEAPTLRAGDWWTVQVEDPNTGETYTAKRVVASQHGSTYDVGLAADSFQDAVVILHWPSLGEVSAQDLSFSVHNENFKPVDFPLEGGKTWETSYFGTTYSAEVVSVDGTTATISMDDGSGDYLNLTYDAEKRAITQMAGPLGLEMQVTDQGTGHEGDVVVPHGRAQHISGRLVGAFGLGGPLFGLRPAPPTGSVDVAEPEASVALIAGSVTVDGQGTPGLYQETATTPGDTALELQTTGTDGLVYKYGHADSASGTWEFEHVAGGAGAAASEVIAYEKLTVTLDGSEAASGS